MKRQTKFVGLALLAASCTQPFKSDETPLQKTQQVYANAGSLQMAASIDSTSVSQGLQSAKPFSCCKGVPSRFRTQRTAVAQKQ